MNTNLFTLLKPTKLKDIAGQQHILNKNGLITKMIEKNEVYSLIFFGPPGIGKTTLAKVLCQELEVDHDYFNPTIHKKQFLETILKNHENKDKRFVLIIDEIHRMNRDKQDILLSYLEKNNFFIFGTTTENPYFSLNPAIRSRAQLIPLNNISKEEMEIFLQNKNEEHNLKLRKDIINLIIENSGGDLRSALNSTNILVKLFDNLDELTIEQVKNILPSSQIIGSSYGNDYYDLQSAFHKSLRGSDVDASIYYLARLIAIGDLQSICRRMIAMAYEDIGLANPNLVSRVVLAINSAERLGFPEAKQILATMTIEMCLSPKSNSAYLAITSALSQLETGKINLPIPNHIKDQSYNSAKKLGISGYKYPHDYENNWVEQEYLPKQLKGVKFYDKGDNAIENKMNHIHYERTKNEKK